MPGREFSRTERLLIRFDSYGPGSDKPTVTAVLMNRAGQKMSDVQIAPAAAGAMHQIDLGLASFPSGEYLVEITAKSGDAGSEGTGALPGRALMRTFDRR